MGAKKPTAVGFLMAFQPGLLVKQGKKVLYVLVRPVWGVLNMVEYGKKNCVQTAEPLIPHNGCTGLRQCGYLPPDPTK